MGLRATKIQEVRLMTCTLYKPVPWDLFVCNLAVIINVL